LRTWCRRTRCEPGVQWNSEWFGAAKSRAKEKERIGIVQKGLDALNGDLFVLQEVVGRSEDGRYAGVVPFRSLRTGGSVADPGLSGDGTRQMK
jgi:hypothetical protein